MTIKKYLPEKMSNERNENGDQIFLNFLKPICSFTGNNDKATEVVYSCTGRIKGSYEKKITECRSSAAWKLHKGGN